jgi:hypothetical protein
MLNSVLKHKPPCRIVKPRRLRQAVQVARRGEEKCIKNFVVGTSGHCEGRDRNWRRIM